VYGGVSTCALHVIVNLIEMFSTRLNVVALFLAFDFCRFCVVIRLFHPHHNGQWPPSLKDFYPSFFPLLFLTILIFEIEPVFPFLMFSASAAHWNVVIVKHIGTLL